MKPFYRHRTKAKTTHSSLIRETKAARCLSLFRLLLGRGCSAFSKNGEDASVVDGEKLLWAVFLCLGLIAEIYFVMFAISSPGLFHHLIVEHPRLGRILTLAILLIVGKVLF